MTALEALLSSDVQPNSMHVALEPPVLRLLFPEFKARAITGVDCRDLVVST